MLYKVTSECFPLGGQQKVGDVCIERGRSLCIEVHFLGGGSLDGDQPENADAGTLATFIDSFPVTPSLRMRPITTHSDSVINLAYELAR